MNSRATAAEYLTTTRVGEKGQVTVPKSFRKHLGLETGAPIAVLRVGDGLILLPEQERFELLCKQISDAFSSLGIAEKTVLATLPQARERVFAHRYKNSGSTRTRRRKQAKVPG